jgi:hypothetical protein
MIGENEGLLRQLEVLTKFLGPMIIENEDLPLRPEVLTKFLSGERGSSRSQLNRFKAQRILSPFQHQDEIFLMSDRQRSSPR